MRKQKSKASWHFQWNCMTACVLNFKISNADSGLLKLIRS